jgi:anti-sigma regulatory factor (Ser/Thr protein kinase)
MALSAERPAGVAAEHSVHFYESASGLARTVGDYLEEGLRAGARAVVIATAEHRAALEAELAARGLELVATRPREARLWLDASEVLPRLLSDDAGAGGVDAKAFERVVGTVLRRAAASGAPLRAYGELVDLLWMRGDVAAAIELERLWNELIDELGFPLLCAYCATRAAEASDDAALRAICEQHSAVSSERAVSQRFDPELTAPRAARLMLHEALERWDQRAVLDDAALILSELVTNAVVHARSPLEVSIRHHDGKLRLSVHDQSPARPRLGKADCEPGTGRGLRLIAELAADWGIAPSGPGKVVWAELAAEAQATTRID